MSSSEVELQLSNGFLTIIDAQDLERVSAYHWHARYCRPSRYAARTTSTMTDGVRKVLNIYLHRYLLNAPAGMQVDHKNNDTLDNRRCNLEIVTPEENQARRLRRRFANAGR